MWLDGFVTRFVTPVKLLPVPWQVAQADVAPAWSIAVPAKLEVDLWQVAQSDVVGMCPETCGTGVTPAKAMPAVPAA